MSQFTSVLIGDESLLVQCAETLRSRGHVVRAVVTRNPEVIDWAAGAGIARLPAGAQLGQRLADFSVDWLFSISNLALIPEAVLALPARGAINFHDGPLPERAGLNTPVWALLEGARRHAITWHLMEPGCDTGDVLLRQEIDIAPDETALTLNAKCFAAAVESFAALLDDLEAGSPRRQPQDSSLRRLHRRNDRPEAAALLDFTRPAAELAALVRALDHGGYRNPLACPKIEAGGDVLLVGKAEETQAPEQAGAQSASPGTVLDAGPEGVTVATGEGALRLHALTDVTGARIDTQGLAEPGTRLPCPDAETRARLTQAMAYIAPGEDGWARALRRLEPATLPQARSAAHSASERIEIALELPEGPSEARRIALIGALALRLNGTHALDLAYCNDAIARNAAAAPGYVLGWVPLRFGERDADDDGFDEALQRLTDRLAWAARDPGLAADLPARDPQITRFATPELGVRTDAVEGDALIAGTALTVVLEDGGARLVADGVRLTQPEVAGFKARLEHLAKAMQGATTDDRSIAGLPILPEAERAQLIETWNDTAVDYDRDRCIHQFFEAQAARTPDATALVFEDRAISYADLDAQANRTAHVLRDMGVGPEVPVGLHTTRGPGMLVAALGILKAGGAYVPLDPAYPAERIAHYITDSAAPVIVTESALTDTLPAHEARLLVLDTDPRPAQAPDTAPESGVNPDNLAYLIYTSGSTGTPKGVMVEHRNVASFFAGMDAHIPHDPPGVWLAVTSLSFDISVLELFWTLARGFKLVIASDEGRRTLSGPSVAVSERRMDFSLFYWGNDDGPGPRKYNLLLEGAKFADANGFCAVWTPERHFHAFGGPYPNPAVTGAAVAAVTSNLEVRAGSCVVPLHHPARIAEEWAVIDNLTSGRTGIGVASGWQPDDFVLRPENTPPANKPAMYAAVEQLRALWRGEAVEFARADGTMHPVVTQPRPVSRELKLWVTTAGNPATWREAGEMGANVLTHLLGQSIPEVGEKIAIYHDALRGAGFDPADFNVTLMLHTYVARDREQAREVSRAPMKDYLRSAAGLVKQYAWAFPAFKKPQGVEQPMDIDLSTLAEDEMDAILDFAFTRYFEDSGLFGTVEDCLARLEQLKRIGVDEIACLIDYGIAPEKVMEGLYPLAEALRRTNTASDPAADDFSIAAQIQRHGVTHMQCTPSMARMIAMNDEARAALGRVRHLMVGGEPLPGALAAELAATTGGAVRNMYGPTETTIWSSVETAGVDAAQEATVNIGRPIANTRHYVLDAALAPVPAGVPGELWIGGDGVTRGYWKRPEMTAERFRPDPFAAAGGRMYRTGDMVRWRADGKLDFLGRADSQVKIRGHRIEPGEIEARLEAAPGIRQAVVTTREFGPGDVRLMAHVTATAPVEEQALRAHLGGVLPEYMVPAHIVEIAEFPLTPNGKIDRNALPGPLAQTAPADAAHGDPMGDVESAIAAVWSRVLGVGHIGRGDNFFALGGHSLLAVQAHRELRETLGGADLAITDIFRFPTLEALAGHLDARRGGATPPPRAGDEPDPTGERAQARADAMSRRREMRARRKARAE